jgi:hypothetical protein
VRRRAILREEGSTIPLTVFFCGLALAVVLVVVSITSLYIERKRLFTLADGAALAGAESFDLDASPGGRQRPELSDDGVRRAAEDYLGEAPAAGFESLRLERAGSADGLGATVELSCIWRPPVVSFAVPAGVRIEVASSARSVFLAR